MSTPTWSKGPATSVVTSGDFSFFPDWWLARYTFTAPTDSIGTHAEPPVMLCQFPIDFCISQMTTIDPIMNIIKNFLLIWVGTSMVLCFVNYQMLRLAKDDLLWVSPLSVEYHPPSTGSLHWSSISSLLYPPHSQLRLASPMLTTRARYALVNLLGWQGHLIRGFTTFTQSEERKSHEPVPPPIPTQPASWYKADAQCAAKVQK